MGSPDMSSDVALSNCGVVINGGGAPRGIFTGNPPFCTQTHTFYMEIIILDGVEGKVGSDTILS